MSLLFCSDKIVQNIEMATVEITLSLGPGYAVVEKGKKGVK